MTCSKFLKVSAAVAAAFSIAACVPGGGGGDGEGGEALPTVSITAPTASNSAVGAATGATVTYGWTASMAIFDDDIFTLPYTAYVYLDADGVAPYDHQVATVQTSVGWTPTAGFVSCNYTVTAGSTAVMPGTNTSASVTCGATTTDITNLFAKTGGTMKAAICTTANCATPAVVNSIYLATPTAARTITDAGGNADSTGGTDMEILNAGATMQTDLISDEVIATFEIGDLVDATNGVSVSNVPANGVIDTKYVVRFDVGSDGSTLNDVYLAAYHLSDGTGIGGTVAASALTVVVFDASWTSVLASGTPIASITATEGANTTIVLKAKRSLYSALANVSNATKVEFYTETDAGIHDSTGVQ